MTSYSRTAWARLSCALSLMVIFADLKQSILTAMWGMWTLPLEISKAPLFSLDSGRHCVTHFFSKPALCLCYLYLWLPTLTQILPSKPSGRHVSKPGCGTRTASSESGRRAMKERRAEKVPPASADKFRENTLKWAAGSGNIFNRSQGPVLCRDNSVILWTVWAESNPSGASEGWR